MAKEYKEGDLVLCIVRDVVKTTVFVETEDGIKGSINFSEVAPGRIRNIREYVVPNKIIVCKILNSRPDHLFLSLRRVKDKDKKEMLEQYKKEKTIESVIKKLLGEKGEQLIIKIKSESNFFEFFESAKQDLKLLEKYFNKEEIEKITPILKVKKEKEKEVKKEFSLSCKESDGIIRIKKILTSYDDKDINYLGSSSFMIKLKTHDLKHTGSELNQIMESIEKDAKKNKCEFSVKK
jgi:translation initiation factor 2 alpha subunit (eIF-2alpha)